jgi:hypothetical protein
VGADQANDAQPRWPGAPGRKAGQADAASHHLRCGPSRCDRLPRIPLENGADLDSVLLPPVSRQNWNRRKLLQADHEALVQALEDASEEEGWEFVVADMETLSLEEQVRLAGRTTVMMGVHGNG